MSEILSHPAIERSPMERAEDFVAGYGLYPRPNEPFVTFVSRARALFQQYGIAPAFTDDVIALVANGLESHATVKLFLRKVKSSPYKSVSEESDSNDRDAAGEKRGNWRESAACIGYDPELFFPYSEMKKNNPTAMARAAIDVCAGCAVREACLRFAQEYEIHYGIWGGLTSKQRTDLRSKRAQRTTDIL